MSRIGERTYWHNTSCVHWDIRRYAAIPALVPEQLRFLPDKNDEAELCPGKIDLETFYKDYYLYSCEKLFKERFHSFEGNLSALEGYRRISVDFTMDIDKSTCLKAYAKLGEPHKVFLSIGSLLALEEASQIIFSGDIPVFFNQGFDLWNVTRDDVYYSTAFQESIRKPVDVLRNYNIFSKSESSSSVVSVKKVLNEIGKKINNLDEVIGFYSKPDDFYFLHFCFSRLPISPARQVIADEFSVLCTYWMIAHEDAHRYQGHLDFFLSDVGMSEYDELISLAGDPSIRSLRRAAEIQADTSAIQRQIDLAYDVEFIDMSFDMVSPRIKDKIWDGRLKNDGFDAAQRNFTLRYIVGSAVVPLLSFELSRIRNGNSESSSYPPLYIRILNLFIEAFNRAIAVQKTQPDYNVGAINDSIEVYNLFRGFIMDTILTYKNLTIFCFEEDEDVDELFPLGAEADILMSPAMTMHLSMIACKAHNIPLGSMMDSPDFLDIWRKIKEDGEERCFSVIREFLDQKCDSLKYESSTFFESRLKANKNNNLRKEKIYDDAKIAKSNEEFIRIEIMPMYL